MVQHAKDWPGTDAWGSEISESDLKLGRLMLFGCSFTRGTIREPRTYIGRTGKLQCCEPYGEILGKRLEISTHNFAEPASGNKQIAHTVRYSGITEHDLVMIAWSGPLRPFKWDDDNLTYKTLDVNDPMSDFQLLYETEMCIRSTTDYLTQLGCRFLQTSALMDYKQYYMLEDITDWHRHNFIEPHKPYNSLVDICMGHWHKAPLHQMYTEERAPKEQHAYIPMQAMREHEMFSDDAFHPNQEGHELIADVFEPYVTEMWKTGRYLVNRKQP